MSRSAPLTHTSQQPTQAQEDSGLVAQPRSPPQNPVEPKTQSPAAAAEGRNRSKSSRNSNGSGQGGARKSPQEVTMLQKRIELLQLQVLAAERGVSLEARASPMAAADGGEGGHGVVRQARLSMPSLPVGHSPTSRSSDSTPSASVASLPERRETNTQRDHKLIAPRRKNSMFGHAPVVRRGSDPSVLDPVHLRDVALNAAQGEESEKNASGGEFAPVSRPSRNTLRQSVRRSNTFTGKDSAGLRGSVRESGPWHAPSDLRGQAMQNHVSPSTAPLRSMGPAPQEAPGGHRSARASQDHSMRPVHQPAGARARLSQEMPQMQAPQPGHRRIASNQHSRPIQSPPRASPLRGETVRASLADHEHASLAERSRPQPQPLPLPAAAGNPDMPFASERPSTPPPLPAPALPHEPRPAELRRTASGESDLYWNSSGLAVPSRTLSFRKADDN
jgi:hypothetical protein